jgi:hypothetical protein
MRAPVNVLADILTAAIVSGCSPSASTPGSEEPLSSQQSFDRLSIDNLEYPLVGAAAFASVNQKLLESPELANEAEFIVGPNVSEAEVNLEKELVNKSVRIFSEWYLPKSFKVVMFSEKDGEWADEQLEELGGSYYSTISKEIEVWASNGGPCGFAFATEAKDGTPIYYGCTDSFRVRDWVYQQTPPHEYFHLVQNQYGTLPQWLLEGSAAFFGAAIGYYDISPDGLKSKEFFQGTSGNFDPNNEGPDYNRLVKHLRALTESESLKMYQDLETFNWNDGDRLSHYALGGLATEVLIGVWGLDTYMEMLEGTKERSWKSSFTKTYGLTTDEFYAKLVPYLKAAGEEMTVW